MLGGPIFKTGSDARAHGQAKSDACRPDLRESASVPTWTAEQADAWLERTVREFLEWRKALRESAGGE